MQSRQILGHVHIYGGTTTIILYYYLESKTGLDPIDDQMERSKHPTSGNGQRPEPRGRRPCCPPCRGRAVTAEVLHMIIPVTGAQFSGDDEAAFAHTFITVPYYKQPKAQY